MSLLDRIREPLAKRGRYENVILRCNRDQAIELLESAVTVMLEHDGSWPLPHEKFSRAKVRYLVGALREGRGEDSEFSLRVYEDGHVWLRSGGNLIVTSTVDEFLEKQEGTDEVA